MAIAIGTKLGDFTTGSWTNFQNPEFQIVSINTARFDVTKHRAVPVISDAKIGLLNLSKILGEWKAPDVFKGITFLKPICLHSFIAFSIEILLPESTIC